jgi:hypothetical protein
MSCRNFADLVLARTATLAMLCHASVLILALATIAVAQENEDANSREETRSSEADAEQPPDPLGNVTLPNPSDVPTKGESDAARRLREGKALIVGPSKAPTNAGSRRDSIRLQILRNQRLQQDVKNRQQSLEAEHRQSVESLAQALRGGNAEDQVAKEAVAQWQTQQTQIAATRKQLESQLRHLELEAGNLAAMAAQQQQMTALQQPQEQGALPADAITKVYNLRYSRAPAMAEVLSGILGGKNLRMAVDERTNSLIVVAEKGTDDVVEALLMKLDQSVGSSAKRDQSSETLQLRIVWLLDGLTGEGKDPQEISMNPEVVEALHELGFEDPRVVCQQVTTFTLAEDGRGGEFNFTVPVLIKSKSWDFEGHGQIESIGDERFSLKFDLGFKRIPASTGGFADNSPRQGAQLGGSIYTPLGHYTVMGTTTFVATKTVNTKEGDLDEVQNQHLSAFVVYLDRAREFPAQDTKKRQ